MATFNTESLIRAMHLPIDEVILNFKHEKQDAWNDVSSQAELASIITRIIQPRSTSGIIYEPSPRYIRTLLQIYTRLIEESESRQIEDDELVGIVMEFQHRNRQKQLLLDENIPNPTECCYVSFVVPRDGFNLRNNDTNSEDHNNIVGIKIYPHHNDVGVQKVWEAGAALAEFLIANKHYVKDKKVCELGAGVGLSGIVIAGVCQTKQVHMTDYTNATLENLAHNCAINNEWIEMSRGQSEGGQSVTAVSR